LILQEQLLPSIERYKQYHATFSWSLVSA